MKGLQKTTKLLIYLLVILLSVTCSKDKEEEEKPEEEIQTIQSVEDDIAELLPDGLVNSSNEMAQSAVDNIEDAISWWSSYSYFLEPPENAQLVTLKSSSGTNARTYKWTWNYLNYNIFVYWEYSEDASKRYWNIDIQIGDGPKYNYLDAWESKSEIQGEVQFNFQWVCSYDETIEDCGELYWKYTWNKDASGNYNFTFIMESDDDAHPEYLKYEAVVNVDGSGEIDYYSVGTLYYHIEWDALGNGSWTSYFGLGGSGSWTVTE